MQARLVMALAFCLLAGCGATPPTADKIGAEQVARAFHEALIVANFPSAYAVLAPETRKQLSLEQFTRLAQDYRQHLGFEPTGVQVRFCEERDGEATAHITLSGPGARHRFRDAVLLKTTDEQWKVVLPKNFGQPLAANR